MVVRPPAFLFFFEKERERERERERKLRLFFILLAFSSSTTPLPSYFYLCVIGWSDHFRFEVVRWFSTSVSFFLFCFLYCWFGKFRWKSVPSSAVDRDDVIAGSKRFQSRIDFLFFSFIQNVHFIIIIFKRKRAKTGAPPPLQIRKQEKKFKKKERKKTQKIPPKRGKKNQPQTFSGDGTVTFFCGFRRSGLLPFSFTQRGIPDPPPPPPPPPPQFFFFFFSPQPIRFSSSMDVFLEWETVFFLRKYRNRRFLSFLFSCEITRK